MHIYLCSWRVLDGPAFEGHDRAAGQNTGDTLDTDFVNSAISASNNRMAGPRARTNGARR